jgi:2-polyprenyl-3-methyl-5-hydroxy-6-metoxy-1,4-benzoquinol methylase
LQEGMLQKIRDKIQGTDIEVRISLHQCQENRIGLSEPVDFVLAFYMVHELPSQASFFQEIGTIVKPNGQVFIVEPPFHVTKNNFEETIRIAGSAGFKPVERPKVLFSKAVILQKG